MKNLLKKVWGNYISIFSISKGLYPYLALMLSLNFCTVVKAQIHNGNITLTTQTEIDSFNYKQVNGNLTIQEQVNGNIVNLHGLSKLVKCGSFVINNNSALNNLDSLENLIQVSGLEIADNHSLTNIMGLKNLSKIGEDLPNDYGTYFSPGGLAIRNNSSLLSLDGLSKIVTVNSLAIENDDALIKLDGLSSLWGINYHYDDGCCISFDNPGNLSIQDNTSLINVNAIQRVGYLNSCTVRNNDALIDISGLGALQPNLYGYEGDPITVLSIDVSYNKSLTDFCPLYYLFKRDMDSDIGQIHPVDYSINGNGVNPTREEILAEGPCENKILINAMNGTLTGNAHLGTMTGSINPRAVYFQGLKGGVSFNVNIPESSNDWYVWGRMYYKSSGGKNSFRLEANNRKYVLGDNDSKYNQWHWDGNNGTRINLGVITPGQHKFIISGREPGLTLWIDQLILTDDPDFIPEGFSFTSKNITLYAINGEKFGDAMPQIVEGTNCVFFEDLFATVSFNIDLPASKRNWYAFGRIYCMNVAERNSFYINVNGQKYVLGDNDKKYNQWLWEGNNGVKINLGILPAGPTYVAISGRQPGSTLFVDQIVLTDDPEFVPEGFTPTTTNIVLNAMQGTFTGDARLGSMTGMLNSRCVYFKGVSGGVSYNVNIPDSRRNWYLFGRMFYQPSNMENSFFITFNGQKYILGDDDSFNLWHWEGHNGAGINLGSLNPGQYKILLSGREPGLTLWVDQLLLTDDPNFHPADVLIKSSSDADSTETALPKLIPSGYELSQNYPNPFNPATTIRYGMPAEGIAELNIYDITGQLVRALYSGEVEEGYHELTWNSTNNNGVNVHSGMYFCRLTARSTKGEYTKVIKMILVK